MAYEALFRQKENENYIVGFTKSDKTKKKILIIDAKNTGRIQENSRWHYGLHEFLEIKHDIEPERESLNPISLSHAVFYQMYQSKFGLTGTLGSNIEREHLKEIFSIDSFDVPTYRPSLRLDMPIQIVSSNLILSNKIVQRIQECILQRRPILIICSTILYSLEIHQRLIEENILHEMLNEIQSKKEEEILAIAGYPGRVTIATNTAGRGTDIKLEEDSNDNGGLHVLITFFSESDRVERQARGRAGRQGQKGSTEVIVSLESQNILDKVDINNPEMHQKVLSLLYHKRESQTQLMKYNQISQAEIERYIFSIVQTFFTSLKWYCQVVDQESFLRKYAEALSNLRIKETHTLDISILSIKDKPIAEAAFGLLTSKNNVQTASWKTVLKQAGKRIKDITLNHWSLKFYDKIHIIGELFGQNYAILQLEMEKLAEDFIQKKKVDDTNVNADEIFKLFQEQLVKIKDRRLIALKEEIKDLYEKSRLEWEKYIDISGIGVIEYLREVTQTKLKHLDL